MGVLQPLQLQASLMVQGFSRLLQQKALQEDIFVKLNENYGPGYPSIPDAIYLTVDNVITEENSHKLGMIMPLSGPATYGNVQNQVGREERQVTKSVTIYKNDYSHAVTNQLFGIDAQDKRFYKLLEKETEQLGLYFKELKGVWIRQCLLERYSENLFLASPTNAFVSREWSPNWYIKNLADTAQPTFSQSNVTFTNRIGVALNSAGTGANATLDFQYLAALEHQALYVKKIKPITVSGKTTYIVTVPARQAVSLKNPFVTGSFGNAWVQYNRLSDKEMNWPNVLGRFGTLLLVEDPRSPTLLVGGSAEPFSLTPGYLYPGENDMRSDSLLARDIGYLIGNAAMIEWEAERLHFEIEQALTYNKRRGHGAFGTCGFNQVQYDLDTTTATSREQFSSIVLAFGREAIIN
jgi:hypothetical protein